MLKLKLNNVEILLTDFSFDWTAFTDFNVKDCYLVEIDECDAQAAQDYLPVLTYAAGYCCYSIKKKL